MTLRVGSGLADFFARNAVCVCGEQAYNVHDGVCGWCGQSGIRRRPADLIPVEPVPGEVERGAEG